MLVKLIEPIQGYGYFGSEVVEIADNIAIEWIQKRVAIMVQPTEGENNDLPEGIPSKKLLSDNGFTSVEQILSAEKSLIDIDGIGSKSAQAIIKFCNEYKSNTK